MRALKPPIIKKSGKQHRERQVLLGLIEYYVKSGKPVGSNTLKEAGFDNLSSATIRNYFANLEEAGYLTQQHASGGRTPTAKAFRLYAHENLDQPSLLFAEHQEVKKLRHHETREISAYLQEAAETLCKLTRSAAFLTAPRFDQDYIVDIKLVPIDASRCLCVLITDFGVIQTEVLHIDFKLTSFSLKRIESYFHSRLRQLSKPENLEPDEEHLAQKLYNELLVRFIVGYSNFTDEDIYRTGFSHLLLHPEFQEMNRLGICLSLFENTHSMRLLLKECTKHQAIKFWIGEDLMPYAREIPDCAVIAIPYYINKQPVGAIGLLGPVRIPYRDMFGILRTFSENISECLTRIIYKFKISFRQPKEQPPFLQKEEHRILGQSRLLLLEDQRNEYKE